MDTETPQEAPTIPDAIDPAYLRLFTQPTAAACAVAGVVNLLIEYIKYQEARIAYLEREVNGPIQFKG
jgi:hypothetical protein